MKTTKKDWISVKTDLPIIPCGEPLSDMVWVFDEECGQRTAYLDSDRRWCDGREYWCLNHVTHWMPLPEDPLKEKNES